MLGSLSRELCAFELSNQSERGARWRSRNLSRRTTPRRACGSHTRHATRDCSGRNQRARRGRAVDGERARGREGARSGGRPRGTNSAERIIASRNGDHAQRSSVGMRVLVSRGVGNETAKRTNSVDSSSAIIDFGSRGVARHMRRESERDSVPDSARSERRGRWVSAATDLCAGTDASEVGSQVR